MDATCGAVLALIALLELDAKRIIVVGHSLGAIVASEVSLHLGLLGTVLIGPVNPSAALAEVFTARLQLLEKEGMEGIANVVPFAATGPGATATQQAFIRALLLAQSPEGYASLCRMIINAQRPRYEDIKCPLLIITGSHDETAPMSGSQQILRRHVSLCPPVPLSR
ncbi:alpha/beta hydrolase fold family protein [Moelleriella libera RCEF 2490]|uniref:Alpha/beta hydrolase fold family protein n=1 Tax=Moelleriella libera RCEF 2490 TaxID=1081109 RepID=A0A167VUY0_9HYPO|nr:alpha/beta hydrolase fold family protein [Moelleriella libera RCEF 2490]